MNDQNLSLEVELSQDNTNVAMWDGSVVLVSGNFNINTSEVF